MGNGPRLAEFLEDVGFGALVPVRGSVFWDMNLIRGQFPERSWNDEQFEEGYLEAFGGRPARWILEDANWFHSWRTTHEPVWNQKYFSAVKHHVDVPVPGVGGVRKRSQIDDLLKEGNCDLVGRGRPFYAEPKRPTRLLNPDGENAEVLCANCNNSTVPQVTGPPEPAGPLRSWRKR